MSKPTVIYIEVNPHPSVGKRVMVRPINHPSHYVQNGYWAETTAIQIVHVNGFETKNTIYKQAAKPEHDSELSTKDELLA